ncbi:MAG3450 family membrane protein [Mycoplasmopsis hyopharyngis]|uniref:MAG3450 family membrane protein n=1 Tax=Mycoplasmopsis hyopharyngis TaxID=29558 RepID=UPI0038731F8F
MNNKYASLRPFILTLFLSIFVILPNTLWWLFATNDTNNQLIKTKWMIYTIPVIWFLFIIALSSLLIFFKVLSIKSLNWIIPLELAFISVISSTYLDIKFRFLIVFLTAVIFATISNLLINYIMEKIDKKDEQKKPNSQI